MTLHIRTATTSDLHGLIRLYQDLHADDPPLAEDVGQHRLAQIAESPWLHLWVATEEPPQSEAPLVASTYLNIVPNLTRAARPYAVIENVVTVQRLRGQGVGQALMAHTLAFAWQQGCYKAMLQTGSKTPATHAFYRRCGFRSADKTGYVARPTQTKL